MAMAALAMQTTPSERGGRVAYDYQRMGIYRLRELARQSHPDHTEEAPRAFVMRALDMEVERRTVLRHENTGWHNHSPGAPGFAPGGTDIAREPLAVAYDKGIRAYEAHEYVRRWLQQARLTDRQLLAVLIQSAKTDRRVPGPWAANYDQIAADIGHYAQLLGWSPGTPVIHVFECIEDKPKKPEFPPPYERVTVPRGARERAVMAERYEQSLEGPRMKRHSTRHEVPAFKSGKGITEAARRARTELILLAQV